MAIDRFRNEKSHTADGNISDPIRAYEYLRLSSLAMARILLLLAQFGKEEKPETVIPKMSQESLAEMVGTTRSRVSFFMNRFREMGFVDYDGSGLQVHSSLLNVVLHD
jgi:CRP/FNR family transcriptional regulator, cyclic AMP receptor protein